ncbi:MAG TPA: hypothetical protein VEQ84_18495 [Vicinamibacteria bacterium]|nr:hypothetical protein [Vicinamibacteria bacterium]
MQRTRHATKDASPLIPVAGWGLGDGDEAWPLVPGIGHGAH